MTETKPGHEVPFAERYPLHTKLKLAESQATVVGEFLDFLDEQTWAIGEYNGDRLREIRQRKEEIIGLFLGIDSRGLSREKNKMYQEIRADLHAGEAEKRGETKI